MSACIRGEVARWYYIPSRLLSATFRYMCCPPSHYPGEWLTLHLILHYVPINFNQKAFQSRCARLEDIYVLSFNLRGVILSDELLRKRSKFHMKEEEMDVELKNGVLLRSSSVNHCSLDCLDQSYWRYLNLVRRLVRIVRWIRVLMA